MLITSQVRGEKRFYTPPPMRKLQEEREKKRLKAEEEKRKVKSSQKLITQSSNSVREYSDSIPVDLLIDIFSRVPAKSIARFRCVSKFWESILGLPYFTEQFLTKSVARPRLFLTVKVNQELLVFSSPQNPNDNSSLVATRYKSFPKHFPIDICIPLRGLVFLQSWETKMQVICNPATGESITLPKVKAKHIGASCFGFDPISKKFKVLCLNWSSYERPNTHWILTLGTGKLIWRTIQHPLFPHLPKCDGICVNGVLYYSALRSYKIVCFDFSFEIFSLINMDEDMLYDRYTLFNNQGKLGAYQYTCHRCKDELTLWVLEDAGKHKWSKRICLVPNRVSMYKIVGMTGTGEIVLKPYQLFKHFYIFYYNIERNTLTRVIIKGFEGFKNHSTIFTFLDYVEILKFM